MLTLFCILPGTTSEAAVYVALAELAAETLALYGWLAYVLVGEWRAARRGLLQADRAGGGR